MHSEKAGSMKYAKWATIGPNYEYGKRAWETFRDRLKELKPDVQVVGEHWPTLGKLEAGPFVTAILNQNPDALYVSLFGSDWIAFVREAKKRGLFDKTFVVGILLGEPEYIDPLGPEAPEGMLVTGYPWYDIAAPAHKDFVARFTKKYDKNPVLGSLVGYVTYLSIVEAIRKAGSTDTDKLVAAFRGLRVETPIGPISYRASDGQSTMGAWVGTTKLDARRGVGIMVNYEYVPGEKVLPSDDDVKSSEAATEPVALPRPAPRGARARDGPLPHRVRALAHLWRDPRRQLRARLLLHAGRLPRLHAGAGAAAGRRVLLRGGGAGRARRGRARHAGGGGPPAPCLPRARALPAPAHLRARARRLRRRQAGLGQREQDGAGRARARRRRPHRGAARAHVRSRAHRARARRGRGALVALLSHALGRPHPRGHSGPRDGGAARRRSGAALHRRVRAWLRAGRPGRRAADSTAGAHHRHGRGHHHGGLRGGRGGRHGLRAGRAAGRHPHRRHRRLRRARAAAGLARAHVRGDGGRARRAPVGTARAARGPGAVRGRRHRARRRRRGAPLARRRRRGGLGGAAATAAHVLRLGPRRDPRVRLVRGQPASADGHGRHGLVRPRGGLRPRCLWRGAARAVGEGADARRLRSGAAGGRPRRRRHRLLLRAALVDLLRDAHAGRSTNRLRDRAPVVRRDGRRQRPPRHLARALARLADPLLLPGARRLRCRPGRPRRGRPRAVRPHAAGGARSRAARGGGRDRRARAPVAGLRRRRVLRWARRRHLRVPQGQRVPRAAGGAGLGGAARDGAAGRRAFPRRRAPRRRALQAPRHRGDALHGILAARPRRHPRGPRAGVPPRNPRRAGGARAWLSARPCWRWTACGARSAASAPSTACPSPWSAARSARSSAPTAPASPPSSTSSPASCVPTPGACAGAGARSAGCRRTRSGAWGSAARSRSPPPSPPSPCWRTCRSRGCRTRAAAARC